MHVVTNYTLQRKQEIRLRDEERKRTKAIEQRPPPHSYAAAAMASHSQAPKKARMADDPLRVLMDKVYDKTMQAPQETKRLVTQSLEEMLEQIEETIAP